MRGTGWARRGSPRRAGSSPGTFLFGAGRSGSCAGVARTLLISQCWDGASWARRGGGDGGGRPQPVPAGGGSGSKHSSSHPAGLPFCLARHVPGRPTLTEAGSPRPSLCPSPLAAAPPGVSTPPTLPVWLPSHSSDSSCPPRAGKMDPGPPLGCSLKDVKWSAVAVPLNLLVSTYRLPQIARLDSGAWGGEQAGRAESSGGRCWGELLNPPGAPSVLPGTEGAGRAWRLSAALSVRSPLSGAGARLRHRRGPCIALHRNTWVMTPSAPSCARPGELGAARLLSAHGKCPRSLRLRH